jgi:hypothetical protein
MSRRLIDQERSKFNAQRWQQSIQCSQLLDEYDARQQIEAHRVDERECNVQRWQQSIQCSQLLDEYDARQQGVVHRVDELERLQALEAALLEAQRENQALKTALSREQASLLNALEKVRRMQAERQEFLQQVTDLRRAIALIQGRRQA